MWIFDEIKLEKFGEVVFEYNYIDKGKNDFGDKGCVYLAKADWKLSQLVISRLQFI